MKKAIQIAVPKPCHENWNSFTKTSNGGFCSSCQKEVIDFTSWSDERLKLYFKNLSHNTCGQIPAGAAYSILLRYWEEGSFWVDLDLFSKLVPPIYFPASRGATK